MPQNQVLFVLLLVFLGLGTVRAELPFSVVEARQQSLTREYVLDGVVEAVNQSTVSAQTSGRVQEILVDVNDEVPAGAPIIRLRDTEQRARLNQAQASLREAEARYQEAQAEYERIKNVYARRLVSRADLDTATAAFNATKARREAAQAGVTQAQEDLDNTIIKAPYGGIVLERHVALGETVQSGTPLMTGFSLDYLRVIANVPQRLIIPVRDHSKARVLLPNEQGSVAAERLTFFPYADPMSNVFKVRVYLPKGTQGLYPGMFVKTAFTVGDTSRLVVPREAVVQRSEVSGVYVVEGDKVSLRQVRAGRPVADDGIEILAGLDAGEKVALDPIEAGVYLKERQVEPGQ